MESERTKTKKQLLDALANLGGRLTAEEDVVFEGKKLIVPLGMNMRDAIDFLQDKIAEEEQEMVFSRTFNYRPWDGAYAALNAMKAAFGMVRSAPTPGLFGDTPPKLITINVSATETVQVPWGVLKVPMMRGAKIHLTHTMHDEYGLVFQMHVEGPRKYRFHAEGLFNLVEEELAKNSIYRGKAFDGQPQPQFLDLRGFDKDKVIYGHDTLTQLDANIWAVLKYTDRLKALGQPLKRAVLLEGPYGTGKTLAATWTAKIAEDNGWTFISCRPNRDNLYDVMTTARLYQPAVVFFEDVDLIADPDTGHDNVSQLLDVFDGIQAKDTKIMVVLTTNHVEKLHKGMVRPGRLDAIIHIGEWDADGFKRLIQQIVPPGKLGDVDYEVVAEAMHGFLPAFAKEAVDRAIRYNLARNFGDLNVLTTEDFVAAAEGLRPQLELMNDARETAGGSKLEIGFGEVLTELINRTVTTDPSNKDDVWQQMKVLDDQLDN